ncbi:hypothetical protein ACFPL7_05980 [Dongia soli]|uniref:Secreted protein n=1 Tax=Dongia soli TaxID=600628 RepID=A0ABU5EEX9_9PROT|nr:hypothetical protein [Dongia soli]MDY0884950.1 hypothetical protein [Dongia soli]
MGGRTYLRFSIAVFPRAILTLAAASSFASLLATSPAAALDFDDGGTSLGLESPVVTQGGANSALFGDSARQTADSDPASFKSGDGAVSDKADTAQSIYCKDKGGVVWIAANVLTSLASKPNDSYQVERMRCP